MEIRTTEEIIKESVISIDDSISIRKNHFKKWVTVNDIIKDLKDRIEGVEQAIGNQEDVGYLKALECLLDYYIELESGKQ